eukprot:8145113-Pyramimonas_sp.AAC.2
MMWHGSHFCNGLFIGCTERTVRFDSPILCGAGRQTRRYPWTCPVLKSSGGRGFILKLVA